MNLDIKKVGQFLAKSIDKALWRIGRTCGSRCKRWHLIQPKLRYIVDLRRATQSVVMQWVSGNDPACHTRGCAFDPLTDGTRFFSLFQFFTLFHVWSPSNPAAADAGHP